jgi:hypothetical protein
MKFLHSQPPKGTNGVTPFQTIYQQLNKSIAIQNEKAQYLAPDAPLKAKFQTPQLQQIEQYLSGYSHAESQLHTDSISAIPTHYL